MAPITELSGEYLESVRTLARWHGEEEDPPIDIYSFDDPEGQEVRLLEVSEGFLTTGEAWPVRFGKSEDLPHASTVILVSDHDYVRLRRGDISLPEGWGPLDSGRKVWPE